MPILRIPDHRVVTPAEEPATVVGLTILVSVQCRTCASPAPIGLINAQPAACETCGTVFALDAVSWEKGNQTPRIAMSTTGRAVLSS